MQGTMEVLTECELQLEMHRYTPSGTSAMLPASTVISTIPIGCSGYSFLSDLVLSAVDCFCLLKTYVNGQDNISVSVNVR